MLSTKYRDLSPKAKDRIYKQFQRLKVKKDIVKNRSFYSREDYVPIPVRDVAKIMTALNNSLSSSYPKIEFSKDNPNFLYDFLKVIKEATVQGIEDELPKEVQEFYNTIILPVITNGSLKSKVKNILGNLHDPLFTNSKVYEWMNIDYPALVEVGDYEAFPTVRHLYYADICSDQRLREQIREMPTKELESFIRFQRKKGIRFKHDFDSLINAYWHRFTHEPYRTMLIGTGKRPICYIDKDSYLGVSIRNNGTPAPYLQTAYRNLKVGQNKAGQAIMEVRYLLPRYYAVDTKTIKSIQRRQDEGNKPCSKKQAAVKAFLKKARLQLAV